MFYLRHELFLFKTEDKVHDRKLTNFMLQYAPILARLKSPKSIGPSLMFANISIAEFDPELAQAISNEDARQEVILS